ncbi:hypothetical protein HID09_003506, partial [Escherichia coli]|nr:hypothetical protein [Escherichia coli]
EENMLLPVSGQILPVRWLAQHGSEKPVTHVAREELQALHIARAEELPAVTALAISHNTKLLDPLEIRDLHKLARDTDKVFPNPGNSDLGLITAFFEAYLDADYTDRGLLTKEWMKGNRVSRITRTASGANAGGGNKTDRNERETEEEKPQPSDAMAGEQVTTETMEPDTTEHCQNAQSLDAQSQVSSANQVKVTADEVNKIMQAANISQPDADKLLAVSRGEFVEGISDPNDPKWVKGIQTRDSVNQNQHESERNDQKAEQNSPNTQQNEPETKQPEPVVQQEPEKVCAACGQSGGGNCPDCGAVMGDTTYLETFNEENLDESQEKDPEEMEGPEHPHNENAGSDPHRNCSDETGEASAPVATEIMWPSYFEPGRYENLPNEVYHSANGISSTMLKDARISLMYYHGRHIAGTIPNEESDALLRGRIIHSYVLETDKFADEYAIPVPVPEYVVTTSNELIAIIKKHNASLPALMTPEQMKEWIESYNSTLIQPLSVSAGAEETGILYGSLPVEFRRIPEGEKHTASAMKACIKEYNASLPPLLKTSGAREQLLDQIETVDPELAKKERAKSLPYNISGTKEQLTEIARKIRPELVTLEDWQKRQQEENAGKTFISPDMYEQAKNIHAALQNNTDAARLLNHPDRKSEISYFGFDEETGLEIRVRPDIEIRLPYESICADVKSVSLGYVRQERLKDRLHREIIERDYHLSAAMYCDVANLDKFFWIFVNKDAGYHWVAVVEASQELLELGRQEYRRTLHQINEALETNNWPAPITESYTDELNDFDLRRLEALSI